MTNKRWASLKNHKGIRKDLMTGKYVARKYIENKEYSESFDNLAEALSWRRNFHPLLTNTEINIGPATKTLTEDSFKRVQTRLNGADQRFTLGQVWELYKEQFLKSVEPQTWDDRMKFAKDFFPDLLNVRMVEMTPEVIDAFMQKKVKEARIINNPRRFNFDNDLKCFKAILNWYKENYDGMFVNPILKRHYIQGIIKKKPQGKKKKMSLEQVILFLSSFDSQFWKDFAEFQFYMTGRVAEAAGIQVPVAKRALKDGELEVSDVSIWGEDKKFSRLKEYPKNGEDRSVHLNNRMVEILQRRIADRPEVPFEYCRESSGKRLDFVFHLDGEPLTYRQIQYNYNKALQKAGLYPEFTSTRILRSAMANIVRRNLGLDAAQAAGGWKSREVVEKHYTDAPNDLNKEAVMLVEKLASGYGVTHQIKNDELSSNSRSRLRLIHSFSDEN